MEVTKQRRRAAVQKGMTITKAEIVVMTASK
jgi:hypothetical protein